MRPVPFFGATFLLLIGSPLHGQIPDSALVRIAQEVSLATLDPTAPSVSLAQWLAQLGRVPLTALQWEVNDCGEGGDGRPAPTCVEGRLVFAPDTAVAVDVIVLGLDGAPADRLALFMLYGQQGTRITWLKSLPDLEALVGQWRR